MEIFVSFEEELIVNLKEIRISGLSMNVDPEDPKKINFRNTQK